MEKILGKSLKQNDSEEYNLGKLEESSLIFLFFGASFCPPS
jgi:hypothetical protein